jgi:hypothetical protein
VGLQCQQLFRLLQLRFVVAQVALNVDEQPGRPVEISVRLRATGCLACCDLCQARFPGTGHEAAAKDFRGAPADRIAVPFLQCFQLLLGDDLRPEVAMLRLRKRRLEWRWRLRRRNG